MADRIYTVEDRKRLLQEQTAEKKRMAITFWSEYKKVALKFPNWLFAFVPPVAVVFAYITHNPEVGLPALIATLVPGIPANIGVVLETREQVEKKRKAIRP